MNASGWQGPAKVAASPLTRRCFCAHRRGMRVGRASDKNTPLINAALAQQLQINSTALYLFLVLLGGAEAPSSNLSSAIYSHRVKLDVIDKGCL